MDGILPPEILGDFIHHVQLFYRVSHSGFCRLVDAIMAGIFRTTVRLGFHYLGDYGQLSKGKTSALKQQQNSNYANNKPAVFLKNKAA